LLKIYSKTEIASIKEEILVDILKSQIWDSLKSL
jgi:hypothetical protein